MHFHALRPVPANIPPTVSITSPANNATFTAPAAITLTANAVDTDGTITKVEFFHGGTTLIATVTAAPYTFNWTNVAAASYTLTAKATDNQNGTITSAPVNVTVNTAVAQLYYIHTDHLNTPRAISNATGQDVWRWDHTEPFGADMANGNPSGLGAFEFNLRYPGQYFDKESNTHYNMMRDYDPAVGRYIQADPLGIVTTKLPTTMTRLNHLYAYVDGNPLTRVDPMGLQVTIPFPGFIIRPFPPIPFPFDPVFPFVPPGQGGSDPGDCKLLTGINHGAVPGGYSLTCYYQCTDGTGFYIELNPWKVPNCPDYWIGRMASNNNRICRG